jgi:hypothetical protein
VAAVLEILGNGGRYWKNTSCSMLGHAAFRMEACPSTAHADRRKRAKVSCDQPQTYGAEEILKSVIYRFREDKRVYHGWKRKLLHSQGGSSGGFHFSEPGDWM